jgi:hypothetical protein
MSARFLSAWSDETAFAARRVTAHLSADGELDPFPITRRPVEARPAGTADPARSWAVSVELDFDPTALGEYWLSRCHGFLVETPTGDAIGVVDDVHVDQPSGQAISVAVAAGWFGRRRFSVPADNVRVILPHERRLLIDRI